MNVSFRNLFLLLALTLPSFIVWAAPQDKPLLDLFQSIAIAESALARNGVSRSEVELVGARRHSLPHNAVVPYQPVIAFDKMLAKKLSGRVYWLVSFSTPGAEMGGEYDVFIDAGTGEIIHFYIGR